MKHGHSHGGQNRIRFQNKGGRGGDYWQEPYGSFEERDINRGVTGDRRYNERDWRPSPQSQNWSQPRADGDAESSFAGKGPKGYNRNDERIYEDVCETLTQDPGIDASEFEVTVAQGEVMLIGTVESREMKRKAEEVIENLSGVKEVSNQLKLKKDQTARGSRSKQDRAA